MSETGKQLASTVKEDGTLELSIIDVPVPSPAEDEVVVRVEAAPINPSDLGLVLGMADISTIAQGDGVVTAQVPPAFMPMHAQRLNVPVPCGNEGAGVVCAAGSSADGAIDQADSEYAWTARHIHLARCRYFQRAEVSAAAYARDKRHGEAGRLAEPARCGACQSGCRRFTRPPA